jgi:serine/alanine adding enzyme
MREASRREISGWDELVVANPDGGQILQTRAWGEFKRQQGWTPLYMRATVDTTDLAILVLQRRIPALGALWYVPKGPGVVTPAQLGGALDGVGQRTPAFVVKVEPEIEDSPLNTGALPALGLRKARHDVQITRATIVVDIRPHDDALLATFKPKCRYNIRLAGRHGVEVSPVPLTGANIDTMYSLMAATQERAGFTLRSKAYFAGYWRLHEAAGQGQLFFARLHDQVLAGLYTTFLGRKAWYKDGGSVKEHGEVMAPYLLQWEAMRWLRDRGIDSYDLVAVPPRAQLTPAHPLYGLYRFKSGFSDRIIEFVGTWDLPIKPARYALWDRAAERAAHQWAYRIHHDLFY